MGGSGAMLSMFSADDDLHYNCFKQSVPKQPLFFDVNRTRKQFIMLMNNQKSTVLCPEDLAASKNLKEQLYLGLLQSIEIGDFRKTLKISPYEQLLAF